MKTIATIQVDLEVTSLGTASRLGDDLHGKPVLRRTVERISRATRIDGVHVLCPSAQFDRCADLLKGTRAQLHRHDAGPSPWGQLVQTARKWSLDGWRGGIGGTTSFDEHTDCRLIEGLLQTVECDTVLSIPAASPLIDPALADQMIQHRSSLGEDVRLVFAQAPPGVAGVLLDAGLVKELQEKNSPVGWVFGYKPDSPEKDLIVQPCCYGVAAEVRYAVGRVVVDTDRSLAAVTAILDEHDDPDAACIGRWLARYQVSQDEPLPREVEIELTTDDPFPEALLRPRGERIERRGPIDPDVVGQVAAELCRFDDALIVLGGLGDPLEHPRFSAVLRAIREAPSQGRRIYGLAVRTTAANLTDEHIEAMIANRVDVLQVTLDAWTATTYSLVQSPHDPSKADLADVLKRLDRLAAVRQEHRSVQPITLPDMTKARDNVHELDEFHDGWLRRGGAVSISACSHYAGQCEDRSAAPMAPAARIGCGRIRSRCMVLADGRVVLCDQDIHGHHAVGRLGEHSLEQLWRSEPFQHVRASHRAGEFDPTPLCAACEEWHRP